MIRDFLSVGMLVASLLATGGCDDVLPLAMGVDEISATELRDALARDRGSVMVIDMRDDQSFAKAHIAGAVRASETQIPRQLAHWSPGPGRLVAVVCTNGHLSLRGALVAAENGRRRAKSLRGGMEAWKRLGYAVEAGPAKEMAAEQQKPLEVKATRLQQVAVSVAAFGFKSAYMALALLLILVLWRARGKDMWLLRRGMVFFLLGEAVCAGNYLVAGNGSEALEQLHGVGMVFMGTYLAWGLVELLDTRVLRFSDETAACALSRLCRRCWKREEVSCGLQRTFVWVAPTLALTSLLPLASTLVAYQVTVDVLGSEVFWTRDVGVALVEQRVLPVLAASAFLLASWRLRGGKAGLEKAKRPFFWGVGIASFAFFRLFLAATFVATPLWSDVWEELTELLTVMALAFFLFFFRRPLGLSWVFWRPASAPAEAVDEAA